MWPGLGFLQAFQVVLIYFQGWKSPMLKTENKNEPSWASIKIKLPWEYLHKLQTILFRSREKYSTVAVRCWGLLVYHPTLLLFKSGDQQHTEHDLTVVRTGSPQPWAWKGLCAPNIQLPTPARGAGLSFSAVNKCFCCLHLLFLWWRWIIFIICNSQKPIPR